MSYHDQKYDMVKKVKKHYDHIRSPSMKNVLVGGEDAVEMNSQYDGFYSVFLSFRAYLTSGRHHSDAACPLQGSAQKPR